MNARTLAMVVSIGIILLGCQRNSHQGDFSLLGRALHRGKVVEFLKNDADSTERSFVLRIAKSDLSTLEQDYLSFKNEPYLSNSICLARDMDTLRPVATMAERAYEASPEFFYVMTFPEQIRVGKGALLVIANFLNIGDTLALRIGT